MTERTPTKPFIGPIRIMPRIQVTREHRKPLPEAKCAIEALARGFAEKFAIAYEWREYTLHFKRTGVSGQIGITATLVEVQAEISFLMVPIKAAIEHEIMLHLEREFS
jgi:putative polyhydroxyalkanoate system protein